MLVHIRSFLVGAGCQSKLLEKKESKTTVSQMIRIVKTKMTQSIFPSSFLKILFGWTKVSVDASDGAL